MGFEDDEDDENCELLGFKHNEGDGSREPMRKKVRTNSIEDYNSSNISDSIDEVRKDAIGYRAMSQALAQTIVNAFSEVNNDRKLSSSFIPSFIATAKVIRITMYNCESDSLIMSGDLKIFVYEDKTILNVSTILSIWYALNFENYFDKVDQDTELLEKFKMLYKKSNFKEKAGKMYQLYNEKCTKPMTEKQREHGVEFVISGDSFTSPVASLINESVLSHKKVINP